MLRCVRQVAGNGLGLCEGRAIELQMFKIVQMINRNTEAELTTESPAFAKPLLGVCGG